MDQYDEPFFTKSTKLQSSSDDSNPAVAPSMIEDIEHLADFDFTAFLNTPLDQFVSAAAVDSYEELMNMDFTAKIDYQDDYSSGPNGAYIDPAVIFSSSSLYSSSVSSQEQAAPTGTLVDPFLAGAESEQDGRYLNNILNSFNSAAVPLRVIDEVNYPFEQELQAALGRELERENERGLATILRNGFASPSPTPASRRIAPMKKAGNKRPANIRNFNATEFYEPLRSEPASWGSMNPETGDQLFQYTEHGELNPLHTFSTAQMSEYIGKHPLHNVHGLHNSKKSGLTLWVQTVPADSGKRYPEKQSDKCRFADCPDPHRTIRKGEFRVAFDEQHPRRRCTDPFHNAGYVHLYCLEKFFDFPQICKNFNVLPDTRVLREGKNKMAITRDHAGMEDLVLEFIAGSVPWAQFGYGQRPKDYYEYTLCSRLTAEHLVRQPRHLQSIREKRGGNSIDIHKNNLDLCVANARILKENRVTFPKADPKPKAQKKRKGKIMEEEEESVLDEKILQGRVETASSNMSQHPLKKRRSPRSPRTPEEKISWSDDFHNPRLRF
jgi:hypothetical protein